MITRTLALLSAAFSCTAYAGSDKEINKPEPKDKKICTRSVEKGNPKQEPSKEGVECSSEPATKADKPNRRIDKSKE